MGVKFDRDTYFEAVRTTLFGGELSQEQVDGQNAILSAWEAKPLSDDLRWLSYCLSTTMHETASTCQPIEEYGKGEGMAYGKADPETGQTYYGRGYVQLTWRDNYSKATEKLQLTGDNDIEWHAGKALDPTIAAEVMFRGMAEGWFRSPNMLAKFFDADTDDPFGAREIINGDKNYNVTWDDRTIGEIIADYHDCFLEALEQAAVDAPPQPRPPRPPLPPRPPRPVVVVNVTIAAPPGVRVDVVMIEPGNEEND
jgi:putative chitinase